MKQYGQLEIRSSLKTGKKSTPFILIDRKTSKLVFTAALIEELELASKRFYFIEEGGKWFIKFTEDENGLNVAVRKDRTQGYIYSKILAKDILNSFGLKEKARFKLEISKDNMYVFKLIM